MRIRPDELVAGFPARKIRELLRQNDEFFSYQDARKVLGIGKSEAKHLFDELCREGYLERNADMPAYETELYWKRTLKGRTLCKALFSKSVSRRAAEQKLDEFLARVRQVNADDYFLYIVRKVILFGSFLSDAPFVGDLDLAVDLERKEQDGDRYVHMALVRAREAESNGKRFPNFVEKICFAEHEVKQFLKAGSRIIQITDAHDGILRVAKSRVVYEFSGANPTKPL